MSINGCFLAVEKKIIDVYKRSSVLSVSSHMFYNNEMKKNELK